MERKIASYKVSANLYKNGFVGLFDTAKIISMISNLFQMLDKWINPFLGSGYHHMIGNGVKFFLKMDCKESGLMAQYLSNLTNDINKNENHMAKNKTKKRYTIRSPTSFGYDY